MQVLRRSAAQGTTIEYHNICLFVCCCCFFFLLLLLFLFCFGVFFFGFFFVGGGGGRGGGVWRGGVGKSKTLCLDIPKGLFKPGNCHHIIQETFGD